MIEYLASKHSHAIRSASSTAGRMIRSFPTSQLTIALLARGLEELRASEQAEHALGLEYADTLMGPDYAKITAEYGRNTILHTALSRTGR